MRSSSVGLWGAMTRQAPWRRGPSDAVSWHLDQAANTTIYILREIGPTGFLLREEEEAKPFKVFLGDPHTCSCPSFQREKEPCKHICWLLLKRFKLPRDHEYAFQGGLVEREINSILRGLHIQNTDTKSKKTRPPVSVDPEHTHGRLKELDSEEVCPICQDELLRKRLPVTYCSTCGNPVHLNCMKIWAEHQPKPETVCAVKCPLCREDFALMQRLKEELRNSSQLFTAAEKEKLERHLGIPCNRCTMIPIEGTCYKCTECSYFHLCQECFTIGHHPPHQFLSRQKRNQRWRPLEHFPELPSEHGACAEQKQSPKEGMVVVKGTSSHVPKQVLKSFPLALVRQSSKLLAPGHQCRICLKAFTLGQYVRLLPCHHTFHRDCIDKWILHEDNSCPVDKQVLYNPLTWKEVVSNENPSTVVSQAVNTKVAHPMEQELFIPGTGLFCKQMHNDYVGELTPINGKLAFCERHQTVPRHNTSSNTSQWQYFKHSNSKPGIVAERVGPHSFNHFLDLPVEHSKKPGSCKSLDHAEPRKGIFPKRIRGSSSALANVVNMNNKQGSDGLQSGHSGRGRLVASQSRHINKTAASLGFNADVNFGVLLGTSDFTVKGQPEQVPKHRARPRLLSRRPKQIPVSLQTSDVAFLMEGIPLNSHT